jgi:hypothetical protein
MWVAESRRVAGAVPQGDVAARIAAFTQGQFGCRLISTAGKPMGKGVSRHPCPADRFLQISTD